MTEMQEDQNINESLGSTGTLKAAADSADAPEFIEILKHALRRDVAGGVSLGSKVRFVKGSSLNELVKDISQIYDNGGVMGLVYVKTPASSCVFSNYYENGDEFNGLDAHINHLTIWKDYFGDKPEGERDSIHVVSNFKNGKGHYRDFTLKRLKDVVDFKGGYVGFIALKDNQ